MFIELFDHLLLKSLIRGWQEVLLSISNSSLKRSMLGNSAFAFWPTGAFLNDEQKIYAQPTSPRHLCSGTIGLSWSEGPSSAGEAGTCAGDTCIHCRTLDMTTYVDLWECSYLALQLRVYACRYAPLRCDVSSCVQMKSVAYLETCPHRAHVQWISAYGEPGDRRTALYFCRCWFDYSHDVCTKRAGLAARFRFLASVLSHPKVRRENTRGRTDWAILVMVTFSWVAVCGMLLNLCNKFYQWAKLHSSSCTQGQVFQLEGFGIAPFHSNFGMGVLQHL